MRYKKIGHIHPIYTILKGNGTYHGFIVQKVML